MSDYELVIKRCKRLEALLEERLGAQGRGLHEKVSSIQSQLPQPLVRKLRFVATVRNRLIHEVTIDRLDDPEGFQRACDDAEQMIASLLQPTFTSKSTRITGYCPANVRTAPSTPSLMVLATFVFLILFAGSVLYVALTGDLRSNAEPTYSGPVIHPSFSR